MVGLTTKMQSKAERIAIADKTTRSENRTFIPSPNPITAPASFVIRHSSSLRRPLPRFELLLQLLSRGRVAQQFPIHLHNRGRLFSLTVLHLLIKPVRNRIVHTAGRVHVF